MKIRVLSLVICYLYLTKRNVAQNTKILTLCASKSSCESCLEADLQCAWCSDWSYSNATLGKPRCSTRETLEGFGCPSSEIRKARSSSIEFLQDDNFQDVIMNRAPVQLKPQRIRLKLRPHSNETITIKYRPARNYPLDLYYLMDLTWSMKDDKDTLASLGSKMAHTLGTFTKNFRLGFGSYADKPLMPYIFPGHEDNPCQGEHAICASLYSFRHHLELTNDIPLFIQKVNDSDVTGNVDNLEGGLDGIVQAIVCERHVGWTHQARKLILIATDGYLHFAGEGKLGGAVGRNDLQCHLDERAQYSLATKYDYPSLAEVSRLLQSHKVNLIFAVTEDRREEYQLISDLLKEKARVATLASNSSNILEIIKQAYHEIVTKVVLRDNSTNPLRFEYFSTCGNRHRESNTSECDDIEEGHVYYFKVVISVSECPGNESLWKQTVVIDDALASEASEVQIDIALLCGCDCKDTKSFHCKHGINECGLCKCDYGWSGVICDCDENSLTENMLQCIGDNVTTHCSDKGECICGRCNCDPGYTGQFCECSPCDKTDGVECGGRGTCDCGVCNCLSGWEGSGCQCPSGSEFCIAPGNTEVCGGHGYCDCGACRCNATAVDGLLYRGTYCESSASAGGSGLCILYSSCVNATVEDPDKAEELCRTNVTVYRTERVDTIPADHEHYCFVRTVRDITTCVIPYIYEFHKDNYVVLKIANKVCHTPLHAAVVPGIIFATVFLFGLLGLLIWKCWTRIKDAKEYAKFEQEQRKTVYALDENPLFKPATTKFRVPSMYHQD